MAWLQGAQQNVSRVLDLNVGGLFVATPAPAPVGTVVTILLSVPEGEIRSQAFVRNATLGQGMGIEFKNMSQQDADRMERLVTRLLSANASAAE